jgi:hypothetical protein
MVWTSPADVRFGSLADITARSRHVRLTPDSGHSWVQGGCPKSANSGHSANDNKLLTAGAGKAVTRGLIETTSMRGITPPPILS